MHNEILLFRQIPANFIDMPSSIFISSTGHTGISVYDGSKISGIDSYQHYNSNNPNSKSIGVMAVTVGECNELGLEVVFDGEGFFAHATIEVGEGRSKRAQKRIARRLRDLAIARNWIYHPE